VNQEQRAEKAHVQKLFGELMSQTFRNLIALHRWFRVEQKRQLTDEEQENKRLLQEAVAKVLQSSDPANKAKLKAFSAWLATADISSGENVILEDWHRDAKRKGEIRSPITYG
jgi:hypothetical protein